MRKQYPDWRKKNIEQETRKYAAHPNDPSQFTIPPHNSGGAVDLAIGYSHSGEVWVLVPSLMKSVNYLEQTFLKMNTIPHLGLIPNSGIYIVPIVECFFI
ncbi:hypothetical protein [Candidatus Coxiella mudrowiae]|uniref:hypothetical protein n=1 Tax=Candidatus Coxiella mudrowiae TaxID=2054173 RepID=UPI0012FE8C34|nr:hypothetical protein [Candidatus Coxiella mudrowiae]